MRVFLALIEYILRIFYLYICAQAIDFWKDDGILAKGVQLRSNITVVNGQDRAFNVIALFTYQDICPLVSLTNNSGYGLSSNYGENALPTFAILDSLKYSFAHVNP